MTSIFIGGNNRKNRWNVCYAMSRNRTNTITRGMLVLLVDRKKVLLDFISVGIRQVIDLKGKESQS